MDLGIVIAETWEILRSLRYGPPITVYLAKNIFTGVQVAVKTERISHHRPRIHNELQIYNCIRNAPPQVEVIGIPFIHYSGRHGSINFLIMDRLGPSLQEILNTRIRFSMKTVFMIGIQAINRLELIHSKSVVHRNLTPEHMLMDVNNYSTLYFVGFGHAGNYCDPITGTHIPLSRHNSHGSSLDFTSKNGQNGLTLSRRDDLESLGFILIYLRNGRLPWTDINSSDGERRRIVTVRKNRLSLNQLCQGLPNEMKQFFEYVRRLRFAETPNYASLMRLFRRGLRNMGKSEDLIFDWTRF